MEEQLVETWNIHDRINHYLLDAIPEEALTDRAGAKGRTVGEVFAHLHNVRLMWIKSAAPELMEGLDRIEKGETPELELLHASLRASAAAIENLLRAAVQSGGKVKGFKPHAAAFLGYLVSHESHHRGQVMLALKQAGRAVEKKVQYGLWEWGVR